MYTQRCPAEPAVFKGALRGFITGLVGDMLIFRNRDGVNVNARSTLSYGFRTLVDWR